MLIKKINHAVDRIETFVFKGSTQLIFLIFISRLEILRFLTLKALIGDTYVQLRIVVPECKIGNRTLAFL